MDFLGQLSSQVKIPDRSLKILVFFQREYPVRINFLVRAKLRLIIILASNTPLLLACIYCKKFLLETKNNLKGVRDSVVNIVGRLFSVKRARNRCTIVKVVG